MRYDRFRRIEILPGAKSPASAGLPGTEVWALRDPVATSPALIGRFEEIGWLDARVREVCAGVPRLVLLQGDAGIGKTRILSATADLARRAGFRVGVGRARDGETATLLPVFEATRGWLREATAAGTATDSEVWSEIARLVSEAHHASTKASGPSKEPRLQFALAEALVGAAQEEPVALLLDDLHWADGATLALLEALMFLAVETAVRTPLPLLVVAALRPEPPTTVARAIARIEREAACIRLELHGLDEAALRALLAENGVLHPSQQLLGTLARETEGNPLLVQQVLHHLLHSKALVDRHGSLVLAEPGLAVPIPADLLASVSERLDKIRASTRHILRVASLLGDTFEPSWLVRASGGQEEVVLSAIDEALAAKLLQPLGDLVGFPSPLFRQMLRDELNPLRRKRLHARIGDLIAWEPGALEDVRVAAIAHHWIEAGNEISAEQRVSAARRSAARASALGDWHAVALLLEAALAISTEAALLSPVEHAALHQEAALAHHRNVDVGPCLHHYDCAADCFREAGDLRGMALIRMSQLRARFTLASVAYGTLPDVSPLEVLYQELDPAELGLRARILSTLGEAYWHGRQSDKAAALAKEALVLSRSASDPAAAAQAFHLEALVHSQRLELREAVEAWWHALAEARLAKDERLVGWPLQRLPLALTCLGRIEAAEEAAQEANRLTRRDLDWGQLSLVLASRTSLSLVRGDLDAVETHAREAMRMTRRSGYPWGGAVALSALALARTLRADPQSAEDAVDLLARPGGAFEEPGLGVQLVARVQRAHVQAHAAAADGRLFEVAQDFDLLVRALCHSSQDVNALGALCAAVEIAALGHRGDLAEMLGAALAPVAARGIILSNGAVFLIPRVLGVAAAAAGQPDDARLRLVEAGKTAEAIGARVELARTRLDQSKLEDGCGAGVDVARAFAVDALRLAQELGLELVARCARRRLVELGDRSYALDVAASPEPVDPQQARILLALSRGRTHAQAAGDLLLGTETLARSLERLDRAAAVAAKGRPAAGETMLIAVTDLVRSTNLMEERGERAALDVLRAHHSRIRACIRRFGGFEIDEMGDGFLVGFHEPGSALEFSLAARTAIRDLTNQLGGPLLRIRVGVHAGEPLAREGRKLFGEAVTGAVRICAAAEPDEILASDRVRLLATGHAERFVARGSYALKGFREPYALHAVEEDSIVAD